MHNDGGEYKMETWLYISYKESKNVRQDGPLQQLMLPSGFQFLKLLYQYWHMQEAGTDSDLTRSETFIIAYYL